MIDATAFRRVRRRVMKSVAPQFSERKCIYTVETEQSQLHCIEFASGKWGNEFSVDIGIHFRHLPSFEAFGHMPRCQHPEPDTCCLKLRWRNSANEQIFSYGDSNDDAEELIQTIVADCLATFDEFNSTWGNGEPLLERLPPQALAADAAIFKQLMDCPDLKERDRISDTMAIRRLLPGWLPHVSPMCVMLAYFAKEFHDSQGVSEYLAITTAPGQGHIMLPRAQSLLEPLN
ncbi:MAG: hypothetical protein ACK6EB_27720 [Planctomyces sp.]